jgi:cell division protein ZapA
MNHINVTINGRQYRMACEHGQEVRLLKLAEGLEERIESLRGKFVRRIARRLQPHPCH